MVGDPHFSIGHVQVLLMRQKKKKKCVVLYKSALRLDARIFKIFVVRMWENLLF